MVTYRDCLLPIRSNDHIITWFSEITRQTKNISTTTIPIAAKLGRMMTYLEWLIPIKSHVCIIIWSCKISWQTEIIMYPLAQCLWQPVLIYNEDFHSIESADPLITSCKVTQKYFSCCITTTTRAMATKLGKAVTFGKKIQPIKSYNSFNMWSCEVMG